MSPLKYHELASAELKKYVDVFSTTYKTTPKLVAKVTPCICVEIVRNTSAGGGLERSSKHYFAADTDEEAATTVLQKYCSEAAEELYWELYYKRRYENYTTTHVLRPSIKDRTRSVPRQDPSHSSWVVSSAKSHYRSFGSELDEPPDAVEQLLFPKQAAKIANRLKKGKVFARFKP